LAGIQLVMPRGQRRLDRLSRTLRALWRDTSALWREFRRPILVFLIAVFGGGWLYGELLVYAGYPRLPYVDLPYVMLTLMVLETATDLPPEPYLVAFWYAMPAIAVYVIGRGAVDFVRLFFNRGERRRDWEEAVASTYRNHVVVLGVGHVGLRVIRTLAQMGFEVVAINLTLTDDLDNELSVLGVPCVVGDGRLPLTLEKAGVQHASAFVVCTSDDYLNLEVTMRVRDFNPNARIVVRMWDNQFANQLHRYMGVEAVLSASDLSAPAFAGAAVGIEIAQTLSIHGVDYSMIRLKVEPGSFLENATIGTLQKKYNMDIVLHERAGDAEVHPSETIPVHAGDTLVIFAQHSQIVNIVTRNHAARAM
jgi:Trk K+ transport system NAD-binding subunit